MTVTRVLGGMGKTVLLWSHVLVYLLHLSAGSLLLTCSSRRRRWRARTTARHCRAALRYLGFRVRVVGGAPPEQPRTTMIVANHMGYLDILVLSSIVPMVFITSEEVRRTPLLGLLATLGGSLFVERRTRANLHREIAKIERVMRQGLPVTLFPEATSSNGETVLPFKASLLEVPCRLGATVLPLCVRYERIDGAPPTRRSRDLVAYYGDLSFLPHFLRLPFIDSVNVAVEVLPAVESTGCNRKELRSHVYETIVRAHGGAGEERTEA